MTIAVLIVGGLALFWAFSSGEPNNTWSDYMRDTADAPPGPSYAADDGGTTSTDAAAASILIGGPL